MATGGRALTEHLRGARLRARDAWRVASGAATAVASPSAPTHWASPSGRRRLLVVSNCQTAGLTAALAAMRPDLDVRRDIWTGGPTPRLDAMLATADALVTSMPESDARAAIERTASPATLIRVPQINFRGFHPDITHVPLATGDGELFGIARAYHSRLVLWGWRRGATRDRILGWFEPDALGAVGYGEAWNDAVELMRQATAESDLDLGDWLLALLGRGVFMHTDNHPRIDAIVQLARGVARVLAERVPAEASGAAGAIGPSERRSVAPIDEPWERVLTDGLGATAEIWPVYPPISARLGVRGSWTWRLADGSLIDLAQFVDASLAGYRALDPRDVRLDHIDGDERFERELA